MEDVNLKILVAIAKDVRFWLHECNIALRELEAWTGNEETRYEYHRLNETYLDYQACYVATRNILETAKQAAGRKIK